MGYLWLSNEKGQNREDKNLKWIMTYGAGVDKLPAEEIINKDILVTNVSGIHRHAMAEQVFAYMLAHARKSSEFNRQQIQGNGIEILNP